MRIITLFIYFVISCLTSFAQKVNYSIPDGYENDVSRKEYKIIVDESVAIIVKRYTIDIVKDGVIQLKEGQNMQTINLHNLIVKCSSVVDRSKWKEVIQEHFNNVFSSIDAQMNIDPENYETIQKYLSIRIYTKEAVNQRGGADAFVFRTDLEGTYSLLMLDLPGAFTPVKKEMFSLWKRDTSEVFRVATTNINSQEIEKVTQTVDFDGTSFEISLLGNEDYAASYALDLANNSPNLVGEWGVCCSNT